MTVRHILILVLFGVVLSGQAQQFKVDSLRLLSNDITASMEPVYDLNNDPCALVKVICSHDFAFSSPLGIVKRRNETGEVWLYMPQGSVLLTLKHPQWGVLRDYRFPSPLQSKTTYELRINEPLNATQVTIPMWIGGSSPDPRHDTLVVITQQAQHRRVKQPLHLLFSAGLSVGTAAVMPGLRLAVMKRHGLYVAAYNNLHRSPSTKGTTADALTYSTGRTRTSCTLLLAGVTHQLNKNFVLYEGGGWGSHTEAWEQLDGQWFSHEEKSHRGWSAEIGAGYCFQRHWLITTGLQTIATKDWQFVIGIGLKL